MARDTDQPLKLIHGSLTCPSTHNNKVFTKHENNMGCSRMHLYFLVKLHNSPNIHFFQTCIQLGNSFIHLLWKYEGVMLGGIFVRMQILTNPPKKRFLLKKKNKKAPFYAYFSIFFIPYKILQRKRCSEFYLY